MKSKNKSPFSRFLALMLAFVMTFTMMPTTASAAGQSSSREGTEKDPMHYDKTVTLEDDGTYTIRMETYATGKVTTSKNQTPTDIVLVLDVSGSMDEDDFPAGENYVRFTGTTNTRAWNSRDNLYVLLEDGTYEKVTVSRNWQSSGWNNGYWRYTYSAEGMTTVTSDRDNGSIPSPYAGRLYTLSSQDISRMEALQNAANAFVDATAEQNSSIENADQKHRISIVKFAGEQERTTTGDDTYYDGGGNRYNYSQIVKNLTVVDTQNAQSLKTSINNLKPDGSTAADKGLNRAEAALQSSAEGRNKVVIMFTDGEPNYFSGFDTSVAAETINKAKDLKDDGVTVYTISVMDGANPNDTNGNMNKYMNAVSNNYPDAEAINRWGNASWNALALGTGSNQGYYKVADNASQLKDIFEEISNSVGSPSVDLTSAAVVRDVLADGFAFPSDWTEEMIKAHIQVAAADYLGNGQFGSEDTEDASLENINVAINEEKDTIDVSGFDYEKNYVVDPSEDGDVKLNGKKLVITITGIEATDAAITNAAVPTNKETSGIYETAKSEEAFRTFDVPTTMLTSKSYVLDFGKKVDLISSDWKQNTVTTLDGDGMNAFTSSESSLEETYGNVTQNGSTLTYEPKTTNWNGYDSFYVFGKSSDENVLAATANKNGNGNVWSKINVIPATSVYYEDDFGYTSSGSKENGYTTIEYTGDWKTATSAGASDEPQSSDNVVYGTDSTYNDDLQYSDGSAHYAGTGATASFTFTGTGLEIYTSTNSDSGRVIVQIKGQTNGKIYTAIVDNEFTSLESGLYQIPTVFFQDVERDTYDATVTVIGDGEGNDTYYLDAIRVYNPLNGEDPIVSAAYADANEADAVSEEVRQTLIDASTVDGDITELIDGTVYIDSLGESTSEIGTYVSNGPKNEVYLEAEKSIAFQIDTEYTGQVLLGIKAPAGSASEVDVTYGNDKKDNIDITSATDMYYVIHPTDDGKVVIENTGAALISITKLRLTGVTDQTVGLNLSTTPELMTYAASFKSLSYVDNETVEDQDENTGDVDIENPQETENPSDSETGHDTIKDTSGNVIDSLWDSIWNGFSSWFGRW